MLSILKESAQDFLDLFYPRLCAACERRLLKHEMVLCEYCKVNLPKTGFHLKRDNVVEQHFYGRMPFGFGTAYYYFTKGGKVQNLLHNIKYSERPDIGFHIGKQFGNELKETPEIGNIDLLVPVPLHKKKLKKRGYNQSEQIAKGMAARLSKPVEANNLIRKIFTMTQTGKSRYSRWENVEGIFNVEDHTRFQDKHILLIDDVITTGSTLEACGMAILKSCNAKISVATLAVASKLA